MNAEQMMKEYNNLKKELNILEIQLKNFKGRNEDEVIRDMALNKPSGERVQTNTIADKTASVALNYKIIKEKEDEERYKFYYERYCLIKKELSFFEECLKLLNENLSSIIYDLIDNTLKWDELEEKYNISRMQITRRRKKALKELNAYYEIREEQELLYILS